MDFKERFYKEVIKKDDFHRRKRKPENVEVWIDAMEWEIKNLCKEMLMLLAIKTRNFINPFRYTYCQSLTVVYC